MAFELLAHTPMSKIYQLEYISYMQLLSPLVLQTLLISKVTWGGTFAPYSFSKAVSYICDIVTFFCHSQYSILGYPDLLNDCLTLCTLRFIPSV